MNKTNRLHEDFFILLSEGSENSDSVQVKMAGTTSKKACRVMLKTRQISTREPVQGFV